MSLIESLIGPIAKIIDKIIPDPEARDRAKLELLKLEGSQDMEAMRTQLSAILAEAIAFRSDAPAGRARGGPTTRGQRLSRNVASSCGQVAVLE